MSDQKTRHNFSSQYGYDPKSYCCHCHACSWDTQSEFCEDYHDEMRTNLENSFRRAAAVKVAWNRAREVLTAEEWNLMDLKNKCGQEYRILDIIKV